MRKVTYILALTLIITFLTGHYFVYKSVLKSHKKEFKAYIRSHFAKIEQLEISPSELYTNNRELIWLDENKEVCFKGVMYDIVSIKNAGTKVVLQVVKDKDEKELMKTYADQFNDIYETGKTGKRNTSLLKDFLSFKFYQKELSKISLFTEFFSYCISDSISTESVYLSVITPPPLA